MGRSLEGMGRPSLAPRNQNIPRTEGAQTRQRGVPPVTFIAMANQIDLAGKTAVVTGGAQGIGRAIAKRLLDSGAAVAISSAMILEAALLFAVTRARLGLHVFIWRPKKP